MLAKEQIYRFLMSLKKTQTVSLQDNEIWGSLTPLVNSQALPTYTLSKEQTQIGRNADCGICINDKRLSGKHCLIKKQGDNITLTDLSTNGTFLGSKKIGKNSSVQLKHHDEIWLLTASKVPVNETIGFRYEDLAAINEERKKKEQQEKDKEEREKKEDQERKKKDEEGQKLKQQQVESSKFAQSIKEQITCSFCYDIMCIPVAVQPCNHRFCGGCLTDLVNSKKDACIQCRKQITTAVRDAAFTSIIQDYIKTHPEEKRDPKQQEQQKAKSIFGYDPINIQEKIHGKAAVKAKAVKAEPPRRGRGRRAARVISDLSASEDDEKDKCRECTTARNGFQCTSTQNHVACHTCGKLIAQRNDPELFQSCTLCTTSYCNIYFPPCKPGAKLNKLADCRDKCKIDTELLRGNKFQFEGLRNYLLTKKINSKDVFDRVMRDVNDGKFSYLIDRKVMKIPPLVSREIKLDKNTAVCDNCWADLWFQMVLTYRMDIVSDMPGHIRDRPVCYWGINCRTMDHNQEHAKRYNHCLYQTRF